MVTAAPPSPLLLPTVDCVVAAAGRPLRTGAPDRSTLLVWSADCVASLHVDDRATIVAPHRAVCAPSTSVVVPSADTHLYVASFDASTLQHDSSDIATVDLDDVMAAALVEIAADPCGPDIASLASAVARRLANALRRSHRSPILPTDPATRRVAMALLSDPADRRGLDWWSNELAVSERTLRRRFLDETGLTFTDWRIALRMHHAQALVDDGVPVSIVARRCGYRTLKAFKHAFHTFQNGVGGERGPVESATSRSATTDRSEPVEQVRPTRSDRPTSIRAQRRTRVVVDSLGRTVSVPRHPERIAALHAFTVGDPLLSLGIGLTAMAVDAESSRWYPSIASAHDLRGIAPVGTVDDPDCDALRRVEPDLIIACSFAGRTLSSCDVDELQRIAPTVAVDEDLPVDEQLSMLAMLVGRTDELQRQRSAYRSTLERLADQIPDSVRQRVFASIVVASGGLSFHTRANPNPIGQAMRDLELLLSGITENDDLYVGIEASQVLEHGDDADVLLVESRSDHPATVERWSDLRAVRLGYVHEVPTPSGVSYPAAIRAVESLSPFLLGLDRAA
ncbi:MAG: helix-turn-helix domain-containing protein [Actinomycetota bacterium]